MKQYFRYTKIVFYVLKLPICLRKKKQIHCLLNFISLSLSHHLSLACVTVLIPNTEVISFPSLYFHFLQTQHTRSKCIAFFDYLLFGSLFPFLIGSLRLCFDSFFLFIVFRFVFSFFVMFLLFVICIWTFH